MSLSYHERAQFFLLFFIDASSFIDAEDPEWEVLFVFRRQTNPCPPSEARECYQFIGYTTLYKFFAYPDSWRLRLSQMLILPPYQRHGHGLKLLQCVYELAQQRRYVEVNVEDPSPAFQFVRDIADVLNCRKAGFFASSADSHESKKIISSLDKEYACKVKRDLLITKNQVHRCYEIFKLASIGSADKEVLELFATEMKSRLAKEHAESLSVLSSDDGERSRSLERLFSSALKHYQAVIQRSGLKPASL